jgi:thiosulfate/3-mercaptopyruvate sulfurtransferase
MVSTGWLSERLGSPGLQVVDGSWYLPASGRDAAAEFAAAHVPGAVFFDLDASSDRRSRLPHMLPPPGEFAERMAALGLRDDAAIVVYDGSGVNLSAPRVWWTFRAFGHYAVALLDGGFAKWRAEGRPVEAGVPSPPRGRFAARLDAAMVRDLDAIRSNLTTRREQLVDMRPADRFEGAVPEIRPGVRSGHIPGSLSLPYTELVNPDGTVLAPERLRERIRSAGIDLARPVVASCGSGTTACSLLFALHLLGHEEVSLYDGSWTEWGSAPGLPLEEGPPRKGPQ